MTGSALREFLRSLGGPLAAVGVGPKPVADLRAVADALEPFADLSLEQLADFLRRAEVFRRDGAVPALADPPPLAAARSAARRLSDSLHALAAADGPGEKSLADAALAARKELQDAVAGLAAGYGSKVKFTDDKKWLPAFREAAAADRTADRVRRLVPRVTSPESYRDDAVSAELDALAAAGDAALKAAAKALGVSATGKGRKLAESIVAGLSGVAAGAAKPAKKPAADPARVADAVARLRVMADRARDPFAIPDSDVDAALAGLEAEFKAAELKAIAKELTGVGVRGAGDALREIRAKLTEAKRMHESQRV